MKPNKLAKKKYTNSGASFIAIIIDCWMFGINKMKKVFVPVLAALLVLSLTACGMITIVHNATPANTASPINTVAPDSTEAPVDEAIMDSSSPLSASESEVEDALAGRWKLAAGKIEGDIYAAFGSSVREQGATMELTGDGKVSFHIGITGGEGTYQIGDETDLTFTVTDYNEGNQWSYEGRIDIEDGITYIEMEIGGFNVVWQRQ